MLAKSRLAQHGIRLGTLGALSNLAIAFPLTEGSDDPHAHVGALRMGFYAQRSTIAGVHVVVHGEAVVSFYQSGADQATLSTVGALRIGNHVGAAQAGYIRWTGTTFEGYDGSEWRSFWSALQPHTHTLADLTQGDAQTGQVPVWNGMAWEPRSLRISDINSSELSSGAIPFATETTLSTSESLYWDAAAHQLMVNQRPVAARYIHIQSVPSATWVVQHGLGTYPSVTVIDSGYTQVYAEVKHISAYEAHILFSSALTGTAYCV